MSSWSGKAMNFAWHLILCGRRYSAQCMPGLSMPFRPRANPAFCFDTQGDRSAADREQLIAFCQTRGLVPPLPQDKHFRVTLGGTQMRWEQHSEFTTYTWGGAGRD